MSFYRVILVIFGLLVIIGSTIDIVTTQRNKCQNANAKLYEQEHVQNISTVSQNGTDINIEAQKESNGYVAHGPTPAVNGVANGISSQHQNQNQRQKESSQTSTSPWHQVDNANC